MKFSISDKIKELCEENDIAISTLERSLDFSAGLISRWDKNSPSIDKITQVADYFNVSIDSLVGRDIEDDSASIENQFINKLIDDTKKYKVQWKECEIYPLSIDESISKLTGRYFDDPDVIYELESNILDVYLIKSQDGSLYLFTTVVNEAFIISNDTNILLILLEEIYMAMSRYKTRDIVVEKMRDYLRGAKYSDKIFTFQDFLDGYEVPK